jgi:hypothetical protein
MVVVVGLALSAPVQQAGALVVVSYRLAVGLVPVSRLQMILLMPRHLGSLAALQL